MRRHADLLLALAVGVAGTVELLLRDVDDAALKHVVVLMVAAAVALRRRPWPALALVCAGFTGLGLAGEDPETTGEVIALVVIVFTAGERLRRRPALAALALLGATMVAQSLVTGDGDTLWAFGVLVAPPWAIGRLARGQRGRIVDLERLHAELTAEQRRTAALAAEAERARIAHEMHDALSHGVGVMSLQAGAGQRLAERGDLDGAREAALAVARAGRQALAELDHLFGAAEEVPRDLDALVAGVRSAGVEVELRRSGDAAVPPDVGLAVHRIVQEALTNAVKHAAARRVWVDVVEGSGQVEVRVRDDGDGTGRGNGIGRGLVGMRERARAYGGDFEAGAADGGGFNVQARLSWP